MARATETYSNQAEADTLIAQYEAQGWRQLHMDFDPDWKRGDEPRGILTFTDEPAPVAPIEPERDLEAEVDELTKRVKKLEKGAKQ